MFGDNLQNAGAQCLRSKARKLDSETAQNYFSLTVGTISILAIVKYLPMLIVSFQTTFK